MSEAEPRVVPEQAEDQLIYIILQTGWIVSEVPENEVVRRLSDAGVILVKQAVGTTSQRGNQ